MDFRRLMANQLGLITRRQALSLGLTTRMIQLKVERKEWERIFPGVFRTTSSPRSWEQLLLAAQLWAGADAVISHCSAGVLLMLEGVKTNLAELTLPRRLRPPDHRIKLHNTNLFLPGDLAKTGCYRITSATRTLIDLAAVLQRDELEVALEDALRRRLTNTSRLESRLNALQDLGKRGATGLSDLLRLRHPSTRPTDTGFETRVVQLLRRSGLPNPIRQQAMGESRVDLAYPEVEILIECDSFQYHSIPSDLVRDAARSNNLVSRRLQVFRVTWEDLSDPDPKVIRLIKEAYFVKINAIRSK